MFDGTEFGRAAAWVAAREFGDWLGIAGLLIAAYTAVQARSAKRAARDAVAALERYDAATALVEAGADLTAVMNQLSAKGDVILAVERARRVKIRLVQVRSRAELNSADATMLDAVLVTIRALEAAPSRVATGKEMVLRLSSDVEALTAIAEGIRSPVEGSRAQ